MSTLSETQFLLTCYAYLSNLRPLWVTCKIFHIMHNARLVFMIMQS
jgi:hypothetical protein